MIDTSLILKELKFLKDNPQFEQRPPSILEFLGENYLNIESTIRPGIRDALVGIFGEEVSPYAISVARRAMFSGAIGVGKTTASSIIIPYMVCWVECLRNPQEFFGLMPGSRIAFMLMSTSNSQAKEVLFGDIKARIAHSPWFQANSPSDPKFKNQIRFPKDIWVLPGNSQETSFEGYNILGGILDEGDSHKQTREKDYAQAGWETMHSRIDSRFNDPALGDHRGLLVAVGQMKKSSGFMAGKRKELEDDPAASVTIMSIWESLGWDKFLDEEGNRKSFWYDPKRKRVIPTLIAETLKSDRLIEIPTAYKKNFENNPEKALRDLAGIPPAAEAPFISLVDRIEECTERWVERHTDANGSVAVPVSADPVRPQLGQSLYADNTVRRVAHVDIAVSGDGDALGFAMGHVPHLVEADGELKPYIVFDLLLRIKAMPGTEIFLNDIRQVIYELRDERNYRIKVVTLDGFESTDTMQQLRKRRINSDYLSVDRQLAPYYDLREAIYERRVEFPPYMTYLNRGETEQVEIAQRELRELSEVGHKVDHPSKGSKDVADAMAAVVHTLMGDRAFRRVATQARSGYDAPGKSESSDAGGAELTPFLSMDTGSVSSLLSPGAPSVPSLDEWIRMSGLPN